MSQESVFQTSGRTSQWKGGLSFFPSCSLDLFSLYLGENSSVSCN